MRQAGNIHMRHIPKDRPTTQKYGEWIGFPTPLEDLAVSRDNSYRNVDYNKWDNWPDDRK